MWSLVLSMTFSCSPPPFAGSATGSFSFCFLSAVSEGRLSLLLDRLLSLLLLLSRLLELLLLLDLLLCLSLLLVLLRDLDLLLDLLLRDLLDLLCLERLLLLLPRLRLRDLLFMFFSSSSVMTRAK